MRSLAPAQTAKQSCAEEADSVVSLHHGCFACGQGNDGLGLTFDLTGDDTVSAEWFCETRYQSYPGILHGGITATILDCAMTNCLLMRGIAAVTANMQIDYQEPVRVGGMVVVRASLVRSRTPLFVLQAEVVQGGRVRATASAKFMNQDVWSSNNNV